MGYHITVNIANHCKTDIKYTKNMNQSEGNIEHGPVDTIPALTTTRAFTGWAKGSDMAAGYVLYYLPGQSGSKMKINYASETAITSQTDGEKAYTACVYVFAQTPNKPGYSAETTGYFWVMDDAILISKKKGGKDEYTATLHVYPIGDPYEMKEEIEPVSPTYYLDNQTKKWVHLCDYANPHPYELLNGTTSIGPGQKVMILDGFSGTQWESPYANLQYSIDEDHTFSIQPESNSGYDGWQPTSVSWPQGKGNYNTSIAGNNSLGHTTITLTES
ncbi:hypothetical protein MJO52_05045 [Microbulbifer variabilis]|jgi:hypothetical protein|uniref:Uncharacterized protein n=1 Tax=Microbulbifer variabilis TaxID=266805 RepID=A0ABY4VDX9_9GAMM|nr:hypothetical protein [Microbulbifer variabilis]USD22498.1 hypothetical protein MJO52_05045 [Microbulbifer variabilis]